METYVTKPGLKMKKYRNFNLPRLTLMDKTPVPPISPAPRLKNKQLFPSTPRINVEEEDWEAFSQLRTLCLKYPLVVVTGLTAACKINLDLFSTKTLVETHPGHTIEVCEQTKQSFHQYWHGDIDKKAWECASTRLYGTIAEYAEYQAEQLQESTKEKNKKEPNDTASLNSYNHIESIFLHGKDEVRFGMKSDLSNKEQWNLQLKELAKLPCFFCVKSKHNMLSYLDCQITGVNAVQLSMQVPDCRTIGSQSCFYTVNINVGPGVCEWYVVPKEYWGAMYRLCQRDGVNYLFDSWWPPNPYDLYDKNIPVYRFYQRAGDLVWLSAGCVYWIRSVSVCNNISWNTGPLTAEQYKFAIERYEWNKQHGYHSCVPMVRLTWNLLYKANLMSNPQLFHLVKASIIQLLKQNEMLLEITKSFRVPILRKEDYEGLVCYCFDCNIELFHFAFVKEKDPTKRYCIHCALNRSLSFKGFACVWNFKNMPILNYESNVSSPILSLSSLMSLIDFDGSCYSTDIGTS